jgi:hypothetical protein
MGEPEFPARRQFQEPRAVLGLEFNSGPHNAILRAACMRLWVWGANRAGKVGGLRVWQ